MRDAVADEVQAGIVNFFLVDAGEHVDAAFFEQRTANPAGRLG